MGYSATAKALDTLDRLHKTLTKHGMGTSTSNGWKAQGKSYFEEVGKEQRDGAVTGSVYLMVDESRARHFGSYRIDPEGKIIRFPGVPKNIIDEVNNG